MLCLVMLSVSATFAADDVVLNDVSNEMTTGDVLSIAPDTVESDVGSDSILAAGEQEKIMSAETVTNGTFFNYFDEYGTLLGNVTSDELIFDGSFSGLPINYLTIDKSIKLTGNDAVFDGVSFMITANDVTVDGFSVTSSDVYGFYIDNSLENIQLSNNVINFQSMEDYDGYGIYACAVSNLRLINNTITYIGNTDGTHVNNAVRVEGYDDKDNWYEDAFPAELITVVGNTFDISIPSVDINYDDWPDTIYYSDGIVFYFVDGLEFVNNTVNIEYNGFSGYADTIYGVAVRSDAMSFGDVQSKDVVIANNTITATGHKYMYAISVGADDLTISGNNITSIADDYYANGINIEGSSVNGDVSGNLIGVSAPDAVYGIYSSNYMGEISGVNYVKNTIAVEGYLAVGMELMENQIAVTDSIIEAVGNYTYGIVASVRGDEATIIRNEISVYGSNVGSDPTGDVLTPNNSMGISIKGPGLIENNTVYSTNIGLNFVEEAGTTVDHNVIIVEANNPSLASYGIYAKSADGLSFTENDVAFVGNTDGTVINNAVRIEGDDKKEVPIKDIVFEGNTFDISLTAVDVNYDDWPNTIYYSDGIVFYFFDGVEFVNNTVNIDYNDYSGYSDTIYGVAARSVYYMTEEYDFVQIQSENVVIADNTITATGHNYIYAVSVWADNFTICGNEITAVGDAHYANGINVESPATNGDVFDNVIGVSAPDSVYGVYSFQYNGPITGVTYVNNTIAAEGYLAVGMEVASTDISIADCTIEAVGNYTYGIVASVRGDEATIIRNEISVYGSNVGSDPTGDVLTPNNSMGITVKGTAMIEDNNIYSTGLGINLVEDGETIINNNNITVTPTGDVENNAAIVVDDIDTITITNNIVMTDTDYAVDIGDVPGTVHDNYLVGEDYSGDESVLFDGDATVYNNTPIRTDIIIVNTLIDANNEYVIAILEDYQGNPIGQAEVMIEINGKSYSNSTDDNGQVKFYCKDLDPNTYPAVISYDGDIIYESIEASVDVIVDKINTTISVVYDADAAELTVTLFNDDTGAPLKGASVVVKVDGTTYKVKINSAGEGVLSLADLAPGIYDATATYKGSAKYVSSSDAVEVIIAADTTISAVYDDDAKELVATLINNATGEPIADADVLLSLGGNNYTVQTDSAGQAIFSTADAPLGAYTAAVSYEGSEMYNPSSTTLDVAIMDTTSISAVYDQDAKELVATLIDNVTGTPIKNAYVIVKANGKSFKIKTDSNGQAILSGEELPLGAYTVDVSYKGGAKYYPATASVDVTVKDDSTISAVYDDEAKELTVVLFDDVTGAPIKNAYVVVKVDGKTYKVKMDAAGQGVLSLDLAPGTYDAALTYKGGAKYNPTNMTLAVIVKANTTVSAVYDDEAKELVATLTNDATGEPIEGSDVVVTIDGVDYIITTDSTGQAKILGDYLPLGTFNATVSFEGSDEYNPSNTTLEFTNKAASNLTAVYDDSTKELTVTLLNNVTGAPLKAAYVVVKVDGKTYKVRITATGQGVLSLADLAPGTYDVTLIYKGSDKYDQANESVEIIVDAN